MIEQSTDINEVAAALIIARGNMSAIVKNSVNPHFKSKFAGLPDLITGTTEHLLAQGLFLTQHPCIEFIQGDSQTPHVALVGCETMIMHAASGQWLRSHLTVPCVGLDPQKAGSAITYVKRYAIEAILNIPTKDDDGNSAMPTPTKPATNTKGLGFDSVTRYIGGATTEAALNEVYATNIKVNTNLTPEQKTTLTAQCKTRKEAIKGAK